MGNLTMSRRTFVKTAAITGAAAAAFGASTHTALAEETYSSVSGNDTVAVKRAAAAARWSAASRSSSRTAGHTRRRGRGAFSPWATAARSRSRPSRRRTTPTACTIP
ncbi:MAG: twin-arginine translocation signal domain-containing protein [Eggerthellaceae bacterium]